MMRSSRELLATRNDISSLMLWLTRRMAVSQGRIAAQWLEYPMVGVRWLDDLVSGYRGITQGSM